MSRENRFFYIVCSTLLSLLSMPLMANPSVPAPKPITDDRRDVGRSELSNPAQLSRNKSDVGAASKAKEDSSNNVVNDKKLDAPPVPIQEEIPMMSPATPSVPATPPPLSNRLNLNNTPPANSQQRMLNPHRPMDSGY